MDDIRRLKALRARVRASYYCSQRARMQVRDARLREALEEAAFARWRLARSIDAFLNSQPWEDRSRLAPTLRDRLACLVRRLRAALTTDRDRQALRWLVADTAALRHAVEICRALSWSLEVSDCLTPRLDELKQTQRAAYALGAERPDRSRAAAAATLAPT